MLFALISIYVIPTQLTDSSGCECVGFDGRFNAKVIVGKRSANRFQGTSLVFRSSAAKNTC